MMHGQKNIKFPSLVSYLFYLLFSNVLQKAVSTHFMTTVMNVPSFYCMYDISLLLNSMQYFISHKIGPADLLNPPPTSHFKVSAAFLICFPKCPGLSTAHNCPPNVSLY